MLNEKAFQAFTVLLVATALLHCQASTIINKRRDQLEPLQPRPVHEDEYGINLDGTNMPPAKWSKMMTPASKPAENPSRDTTCIDAGFSQYPGVYEIAVGKDNGPTLITYMGMSDCSLFKRCSCYMGNKYGSHKRKMFDAALSHGLNIYMRAAPNERQVMSESRKRELSLLGQYSYIWNVKNNPQATSQLERDVAIAQASVDADYASYIESVKANTIAPIDMDDMCDDCNF